MARGPRGPQDARARVLIDDLFRLLEFESVSRDPARVGEVARCAAFVADLVRSAGLTAQVVPTPGHPAVLGWSERVAGRPTVLVYGHYDVQPEGEGWSSPPFRPEVRDGRVYARGASDDKGQFLAHVQAARSLRGRLPVNLVFLIEGEEETGSPHLGWLLDRYRTDLAADVVVISDSAMLAPGVPSLVYGLRGVAALEVVVRGSFPGGELCRLVSALVDERGRVAVPGFYDRVAPLGAEERAALASLDDEEVLLALGARGLSGEEGYTSLERRTARPTLDVNGLQAGPGRAMAKITCRLVPDQRPAEVVEVLRRRVLELCPSATVEGRAGGSPWSTPPGHPAVQAAARAIERVHGRAPAFQREGGTIPAVVHLQEVLGAPIVLMGLGLPVDNPHGPDESFSLEGYEVGIRVAAEVLRELGGRARGSVETTIQEVRG